MGRSTKGCGETSRIVFVSTPSPKHSRRRNSSRNKFGTNKRSVVFNLSKVWVSEWGGFDMQKRLHTRLHESLKARLYMFISTIMFVPVQAANWQCCDDSLQLISFWNWVLMELFQMMPRQNLLLPSLSYSQPFLRPFAKSSGLFVCQYS